MKRIKAIVALLLLMAGQAVAQEEHLVIQYDKYGRPGDFSTLQAAVGEARSFIDASASDYAPNAIAELQDEVNVAAYEIASARASQTLIDEYVSTLKSLLAKAKGTKGYTPKRRFSQTGDHGFVHPGGIVSQADIDRAKRLLADGDTRIKRAWNILCAIDACGERDVGVAAQSLALPGPLHQYAHGSVGIRPCAANLPA